MEQFRQKSIVIQPVKKFPAFYGTKSFITVFTRARHCILPWTSWIQSTSSPLFKIVFNIILSCTSKSTGGLFSSSFPTQVLYEFVVSTRRDTRLRYDSYSESTAFKSGFVIGYRDNLRASFILLRWVPCYCLKTCHDCFLSNLCLFIIHALSHFGVIWHNISELEHQACNLL
jgi:hypothetical protein